MPILCEGDAFQRLQHWIAKDCVDLVAHRLAHRHVQAVIVEHKQHDIADSSAA
jgi:ABC-type thiamine transport system ATPase subunit